MVGQNTLKSKITFAILLLTLIGKDFERIRKICTYKPYRSLALISEEKAGCPKHSCVVHNLIHKIGKAKYIPNSEGWVWHNTTDFYQWFKCHGLACLWLWFLKISEDNWVEMVFCYQNCSDLLWEKIVIVIKKNFWNSRLKAENLQTFWDH